MAASGFFQPVDVNDGVFCQNLLCLPWRGSSKQSSDWFQKWRNKRFDFRLRDRLRKQLSIRLELCDVGAYAFEYSVESL